MSNRVHVHLVSQVVFDVELLIILFQLRIKKQLGDFFSPCVGIVSPVLAALRGIVHCQGLSVV